MGFKSEISWTESTWNPLRGCTKVSAGCKNCYAMGVAERFSGPGMPYEGLAHKVAGKAEWTNKVMLVPDKLLEPVRWKKPRLIFVNSMSDLFHEGVPTEYIINVLAIVAACPQHTFQILTKRPERMKRVLKILETAITFYIDATGDMPQVNEQMRTLAAVPGFRCWPLPNVWIGVSVEDQKTADERIPLLLETPAAVRWVSYEPALGPVDFERIAVVEKDDGTDTGFDVLRGAQWRWVDQGEYGRECNSLDWIVIGGESGLHSRPFDPQWATDIIYTRDRSVLPADDRIRTRLFVKQMGSNPCGMTLKDRKGGDMSEWDEHLRVREWPNTATKESE